MAELRTVHYGGFNYATGSTLAPGLMMWSGSISLSSSVGGNVTSYTGLGLELIANSASYLRFRSEPNELDIRSDKFFLGSNAQYISGSDGNIEISSSNFHLSNGGDVVMQGTITAEAGGTIGGWELQSDSLHSTGYSGTNPGIDLQSGANPTIYIRKNAANFIKMNYQASSVWGITGYNSGLNLFSLGAVNQIAGWTFDDEKLTGGKLVLDKAGKIYSEGFQSSPMPLGGTGFMLTVDDGTGASFLEVENARIRGTLSTAVFEKETINAVGGQLLVANSTTTMTSSYTPAAATTMSVMNVTGFSAGEIIIAKKVNNTGFNTEYMLIESASRSSSNDNETQGDIYVERGYTGTGTVDSSSLPGKVGGAVDYSGSQVLVSTGKINTGFIHMNANPNDIFTPYIDIVERTGSGLYDANKVARLGDLTGIEDNNFTDGVTGYGLYTDNGYFKGKIEVGSIPNQPPVDKLLLHYNFSQATSSGYILDQTPNLNSASIVNTYDLSFPGTVTGSFIAQVTRSIFEVFTSSLSQSKNSFSAGYRFRHLDGNNGRNFFLAKGHGQFVVYKQSNNSVQMRLNTGSAGNDYFSIDTGANAISPNKTYQVFVTAKEDDKVELYLYNVDDGNLVKYVTGSLAGKHFGANKYMGSSYTHMQHGKSGWAGSPNDCQFSGSMFDIRYYNQHVLTEAQCQAIVQNPDSTTGGTVIDGNSIATGKIQSNNYGTTNGTEIDLDLGTMTMGGTTAPGFQIDANGLVQAVNFAEKLVTVTSGNLSSYRVSVTGGYNLVFDGSEGGEVTMNMALYTDPGLIKGIVLPQSGVELNATVNIYPKVEGIRFDDGVVAVSGNQDSKT
mgnify:CR=1 FL=1|tara:strand:- start:507 stop:3029 length:2523 start_codon:yes stop_codon:yes gene_type:complete